MLYILMVCHMPNILKSKKGQFFVLSSISLIIVLATLMRIFSPTSIVSSSDIIFRNEFFVFENIVGKSIKTVEISKDCEELKFNLEEFKKLILDTYENYYIFFYYKINSCDSRLANVTFEIILNSPNVRVETKFDKIKSW